MKNAKCKFGLFCRHMNAEDKHLRQTFTNEFRACLAQYCTLKQYCMLKWILHIFTENESAKVTTVSRFLPARSLDKLYNFADCASLHLIFGLNALHRNPDNSWNASSALSLLKYSAGKKYNISWELGNGRSVHNTNKTDLRLLVCSKESHITTSS